MDLNGASTNTATFTAPNVAEPTQLVFRLTVSDSAGNSSSDTVVVNVGAAPLAASPTADAGANQTVFPSQTVRLPDDGPDISPDRHQRRRADRDGHRERHGCGRRQRPPDQAVDEGTTVTLDGTGSSDPEDGTLTYSWEQTEGVVLPLTGADTAAPQFDAPQVGSDVRLTFDLTVTDPAGDSDSDQVVITVRNVGGGVSPPRAKPRGP